MAEILSEQIEETDLNAGKINLIIYKVKGKSNESAADRQAETAQ